MPETRTLANGRTADGRHLLIQQQSDAGPLDVMIWIDGHRAHYPPGTGLLYRDGGTREWQTDRGRVTLPRRISDRDHRPRLDGEIVYPISVGRPTEVLDEVFERADVSQRLRLVQAGAREGAVVLELPMSAELVGQVIRQLAELGFDFDRSEADG